jgi:hypothetical protein
VGQEVIVDGDCDSATASYVAKQLGGVIFLAPFEGILA